ncbi:MAG: redoxin family protein [Alphaproteobacteria bacterium]
MNHAFCTVLTAATLLSGVALAQDAAIKVGDVLPADVAFTDHVGKTHTFGDFRGKPLVLEWTNPGCPFVRKFYDAKAMQGFQKDTVAKGVTWLAVNSSAEGKEGYLTIKDAPATVAKESFAGTAYVLDGANGSKLGRLLDAKTTPTMVVADKDGKVVYKGAIDSIPSFSAGDIAKAENYALAAVDAVLKGEAPATTETRSYGCSVKY